MFNNFFTFSISEYNLLQRWDRLSSKSKMRKLTEKIVCECGRSFSYKTGHQYHLRWECGKVLLCPYCDRTFNYRPQQLEHIRTCASTYNQNQSY